MYKITAITDVGCERDHNEDDFLYIPDLNKDSFCKEIIFNLPEISDKGTLLIVADGMGGTNAGEVASDISCKAVSSYFSSRLTPDVTTTTDNMAAFMKDAILFAHKAIKTHEQNYPQTEGMGTTLIMAWIVKDIAYIAWVGDSRCYVFHENGTYKQLSKDHSVVQEYIDEGKIDEEMAFNHPQKNYITQSLGSTDIPAPDFVSYRFYANDRLVLCSDGLNSMLRDRNINKIIASQPDDVECCQSLINAAKDAGGYDNITVIMFRAKSTIGRVIPPIIQEQEKTHPVEEMPSVKTDPDPVVDKVQIYKKVWFWLIVVALIFIAVLAFRIIKNKKIAQPDNEIKDTINNKPTVEDIRDIKEKIENTTADNKNKPEVKSNTNNNTINPNIHEQNGHIEEKKEENSPTENVTKEAEKTNTDTAKGPTETPSPTPLPTPIQNN